MARRRRIKLAPFQFKPFSKKQLKILTWWNYSSPVRHMDGIIADGAIRSGKTLSMSLSFVFWAMKEFDGQNFAMCGKTIGSLRRNVIVLLKRMLASRGYIVRDYRTDNLLEIEFDGHANYFYMFGGKDERSQDLIQGITLAGVFFDEVALMPESFVNQATGRCSEPGSKFWFNCNPQGPSHWFKQIWIDEAKKGNNNLIYLHFTMNDNLSLTEEIKQRYLSMYSGVFFSRYIEGEWCVAEGQIYTGFDKERHVWNRDQLEEYLKVNSIAFLTIGVDFGGSASASVFTLVAFTKNYKKCIVLDEYYDQDNFSADHLKEAWIKYAGMWKKMYPKLSAAFMDSAEQLLIKSFRQATPQVACRNARKSEISDRITATVQLMSTDKLVIMENCKNLIKAFESAVWDERYPDDLVRLDDGTVNIDSLDAFEYATEQYYRDLLRI